MKKKEGLLFCPLSGYLLELDANKGAAVCAVSGYSKPLSELGGIVMEHTTDMEDYRRRYNLEPIVKDSADEELAKGRKRATVDEPCPKCKHPVLEFYTMQLRSADEGQTVFYECTKCGHKYSQNN
ncbi:DNA-directed RNA polymerase I subunit [Haematococcus lacustris]